MPRRRPMLRKAFLASIVSVALLGGAELGARLLAGAPPEPPLLRVRTPEGHVRLEKRGGLVQASYQRDGTTRFAETPAPGVHRVAFLGGSSVHGGSHLAMDQEFPALTAAMLAELGVPIEALNMGNPGLDSHSVERLTPSLLKYGTELLVVYTGHNDLGNTLQEQRYGDVGSALLVRARLLLWRSRIYGLLRGVAPETVAPRGPAAPVTIKPITQTQRLLAAEGLRANLEEIGRLARQAGASLLLVTPISNSAGCSPVGQSCPGALEQLAPPGMPQPNQPSKARLAEIESALQRHPGCPELLYERGLQRLHQHDERGYADLIRAREGDPTPMRATAAMTDAVRSAARATDARLVDLDRDLHATYGVPPPELFNDCLHFTPDGHAQLAAWLAPEIAEMIAARGDSP